MRAPAAPLPSPPSTGRARIIGIGNSGNRTMENGTLEQAVDSLAALPGTPEVTDAMLVEIAQATLRRANAGAPEAALVVLRVAEQQRKDGRLSSAPWP